MGRERILSGRVRRSSNRAPGFDYASVGWYFVTIVTYNRECIFGSIRDGVLSLTGAGAIAQDEWISTPQRRRNVILDEYVIMPNHVHAIVRITTELPRSAKPPEAPPLGLRSPSNSLGAIVRGFKAATTAQLNRLAGSPGLPLWQSNYHDRILRSDAHLEAARRYIRANPANWPSDPHFSLPSEDPRARL